MIYKFVGLVFILATLIGCEDEEKLNRTSEYLAGLSLDYSYDTLALTVNDSPKQLTLLGKYLKVKETIVLNTGIIQSKEMRTVSVDSSFEIISAKNAQWFSSNGSVAAVSNGKVTPLSSGTTGVYAKFQNVNSDTLTIRVQENNSAPALYIDPPQTTLIFQNQVNVSGDVQIINSGGNQTKLLVSEPRSGFNTRIDFNSLGEFNFTVNNLSDGLSIIDLVAEHPIESNLKTVRNKTVIFLSYLSSSADSIVGTWKGTSLNRTFYLEISKSILFQRYDVSGTIDIKFQALGYVKDVEVIGLINRDGTIDLSLSKDYEGFKISGAMKGYFSGTGFSEGYYSGKAEKSGWPKLSFKEDWTARKIN
ncbi:MAG: Ig-like domain-containing protein [Bacteroidetes bacterium]|nr:Ig-like domain-containing protein [Bacteroidota bacterium]MBU1679941.1 Ig-like domain-containing protein [Bacteroidota bacterium]MBU2506207.1 Ig-like domain-containing protein [Bacteroidota bacterium]